MREFAWLVLVLTAVGNAAAGTVGAGVVVHLVLGLGAGLAGGTLIVLTLRARL